MPIKLLSHYKTVHTSSVRGWRGKKNCLKMALITSAIFKSHFEAGPVASGAASSMEDAQIHQFLLNNHSESLLKT